jgi:hypothetical protein
VERRQETCPEVVIKTSIFDLVLAVLRCAHGEENRNEQFVTLGVRDCVARAGCMDVSQAVGRDAGEGDFYSRYGVSPFSPNGLDPPLLGLLSYSTDFFFGGRLWRVASGGVRILSLVGLPNRRHESLRDPRNQFTKRIPLLRVMDVCQ